ncbi:hypothetical protein [Sutcliffiella halmapala]|uniref:hypothetical protein n=1 Tax=Sutcliffiella halmapala TaxID=79882 RepID=UPI00099492AC|nr:hypothetical protein [Sutcliffiella halmapala]
MLTYINDHLLDLKDKMRKKQKWEKQLEDYKRELMGIENAISNLLHKLATEQKDVEKLEGFSVTKLFLTLRGTVENQLDKEKQEVAALQLKLEEAMLSRSEIQETILQLAEKLSELANVESDYYSLFTTKETYIKESNMPSSIKLYELQEQEGGIKAALTELYEAIDAGNKVNQSLHNAIESLEKAKGWGTIDMFGGGMLSTAVKHNHIDDATSYIHQAQSRMRSFQKELLDLNEEADLQLNISALLKFTDFFFDGLVADWMVQGRIKNSLEQTRNQQSEISSIISKLKTQATEKKRELKRTKAKRREFVESV